MVTADMITKSLFKLNLWPLSDSNKMIVDIWKNMPATIALIIKIVGSCMATVLEIKVPSGVIRAKIAKQRNVLPLDNWSWIRYVETRAAIGILCINIPNNIVSCCAIEILQVAHG